MEATIDIGNNLTSLLERLAQQIGTTADKVFPWYVQQAYLEGAISLWVLGAALTLSLIAVVYGVFRGDWKHGQPGNLAAALTLVGGACLFGSVFVACASIPESITKVYNPQYHAMKMLTRDIGKLTAR